MNNDSEDLIVLGVVFYQEIGHITTDWGISNSQCA